MLENPIKLFDINHITKVILLLPSNEEKLSTCSFILALSWHHNSLVIKQITDILKGLAPQEGNLRKVTREQWIYDFLNRIIFGVTAVISVLVEWIIFGTPFSSGSEWGFIGAATATIGAFIVLCQQVMLD